MNIYRLIDRLEKLKKRESLQAAQRTFITNLIR